MTLIRTAGPALEPITLAEAKAHLRLTHASEDELIGGLIRAAREDFERATRLCLIEQGWRLVLDAWPREGTARIFRHPVRAVTAVTVYGYDGAPAALPASSYFVDRESRPARIHLDAPPERGRALNGVEIDFSAGFGESGPDVPDLPKRAILMLVAHWYEMRGGFGPEDQPVSFPPAYERLIASQRLRRL
ncbi:MAG TPA: head-tail connector protein [Mesorhizobium sp.]|jgi:uncharacterized phiE125 gp8 family phage protein|nr:head-tail connector protein [Mesorhizobium sp.]